MQALDLNFPLLSDWNAEAVHAFGVAHDFRGLQGRGRSGPRSWSTRAVRSAAHGGTRTAEVPDFDELLAAARAL